MLWWPERVGAPPPKGSKSHLSPGPAQGRLREALGQLWEALGGLRRSPGRAPGALYIHKLPINRPAAVMLKKEQNKIIIIKVFLKRYWS